MEKTVVSIPVILAVVVLGGLSGCARAKAFERVYDAPPARVLELARRTIDGADRLDFTLRVVDESDGLLETDWKERPATKPGALGSRYLQRVRFLANVTTVETGTRLEVLAQVEVRPPAGRRAYRWYSNAPDGALAQRVLAWVDHDLLGKPAPEGAPSPVAEDGSKEPEADVPPIPETPPPADS